jgi:hypothetical protein
LRRRWRQTDTTQVTHASAASHTANLEHQPSGIDLQHEAKSPVMIFFLIYNLMCLYLLTKREAVNGKMALQGLLTLA